MPHQFQLEMVSDGIRQQKRGAGDDRCRAGWGVGDTETTGQALQVGLDVWTQKWVKELVCGCVIRDPGQRGGAKSAFCREAGGHRGRGQQGQSRWVSRLSWPHRLLSSLPGPPPPKNGGNETHPAECPQGLGTGIGSKGPVRRGDQSPALALLALLGSFSSRPERRK